MEILFLTCCLSRCCGYASPGGGGFFWVEVEVAAWVGLCVQLKTGQTGFQVLTSPLKGRPYLPPQWRDGSRPVLWMLRGWHTARNSAGGWFQCVMLAHSYPREGEEPAWGRADGGGEFQRACLGMTSGRRWGPPHSTRWVDQHLHLLPWRPLKRR